MWYRLTRFASPATRWVPCWGLREKGDGPYVRTEEGALRAFVSPDEAVAWCRDQAADFLEFEDGAECSTNVD